MSEDGLDMIKGTLDVLILRTLKGGPNHGYGIARRLKDSSSDAFQVEEGALYPALRRMEKRRFLSSAWSVTETGREAKYYTLTPEGEEELERVQAHWNRYVVAMSRVLGEAGEA